MAAELFNKYIWLVDTIYNAAPISREEINRRWARSQYNETHEDKLPERTFHRYKNAIEELFGIEIVYCRSRDAYYIANSDDIDNAGVRKWLVNTFAVNNLINESHQLKRRILFEEIPSGQQFLIRIIEAMRDEFTMRITYKNFRRDHPNTFEVAPYCVKVFERRWYMLAKSEAYDTPRIYALDRIKELEATEHKFKLPKKFDAQKFFSDSFGIIVDTEDYDVERICVRISQDQRNYIQTLPLHSSQKEIEHTVEYSVFEYRLRPTHDFVQELRRYGSALEVLLPEWLRDDFAEEAKRLNRRYNSE